MAKTKKRKLASSTAPLVPPPMTSRRVARKVTSAFHKITGEMSAPTTSSSARAALEAELEAMGGRARYQEASVLSTSLYSTSKWVLKVLRRLGVVGRGGVPRCLEVGAINTQLLDAPGVDVRAVDLRSTHERIERVDFFDLVPAGGWDVVVCALVLNCVPTAKARGRMVANLFAHLKPGGLCFLVLPLTCVERSSRTTPDAFDALLRAAGFRELERRLTPKLLHVCLEATGGSAPRPSQPVAADARPKVRRKKTTDFHVVLPAA